MGFAHHQIHLILLVFLLLIFNHKNKFYQDKILMGKAHPT